MYRLNQIESAILFNFVVIHGSLCFQIFILHNSRCQVTCGSCKSCPVVHFEQCCYISLVLQDHWCQHYWVLKFEYRSWVPLKPVLGDVRDVALIHSHVQIQSNRVWNCHVILLWLMLPRDHFVSRFYTPSDRATSRQRAVWRVSLEPVQDIWRFVFLSLATRRKGDNDIGQRNAQCTKSATIIIKFVQE
jgi:hypothetical protein